MGTWGSAPSSFDILCHRVEEVCQPNTAEHANNVFMRQLTWNCFDRPASHKMQQKNSVVLTAAVLHHCQVCACGQGGKL